MPTVAPVDIGDGYQESCGSVQSRLRLKISSMIHSSYSRCAIEAGSKNVLRGARHCERTCQTAILYLGIRRVLPFTWKNDARFPHIALYDASPKLADNRLTCVIGSSNPIKFGGMSDGDFQPPDGTIFAGLFQLSMIDSRGSPNGSVLSM